MDKKEKKRLKAQFKNNELTALMASLGDAKDSCLKVDAVGGSLGIQLKHNHYKTTKSANAIISEVVQSKEDEINLAISLPFDESLYDFEWVDANAYDEYFNEFKNAVSAELGLPVYQGGCSSDKIEFERWMSQVCPNGHADQLSVWRVDSMLVYLRESWFDKEAPILIAFGAAGCKRDSEFEFGN